jgi:lysophospholipase L1-like esterase
VRWVAFGDSVTHGFTTSSVEGNLFSVEIGVNNWQGVTELEVFRKNMSELLRRLRTGHPDAPVYVITPLWVPPSCQPKTAKYPLDDYRRISILG